MQDQHLLLLGEIKGKVDAIEKAVGVQGQDLKSIDGRLRSSEQRHAAAGAVAGGAISVGMALLIEGLKGWLGSGGGKA